MTVLQTMLSCHCLPVAAGSLSTSPASLGPGAAFHCGAHPLPAGCCWRQLQCPHPMGPLPLSWAALHTAQLQSLPLSAGCCWRQLQRPHPMGPLPISWPALHTAQLQSLPLFAGCCWRQLQRPPHPGGPGLPFPLWRIAASHGHCLPGPGLCQPDHGRCLRRQAVQLCSLPGALVNLDHLHIEHTTSTYETPRPAPSMVGGGAAATAHIVTAA